jgi:hypothetical protein
VVNYLRVPHEISFGEILGHGNSWSASMFRRVIIPSAHVKRVGELLRSTKPFEKGIEPGSMYYLPRSTHYFIRTKALQDHSSLLYPKGDSIIPISPKVFEDPHLADGDILMSKDSNVGECAMVDGEKRTNHMFSGGIVRLHPATDRYYFFAFLKHPLFKTQLLAMSPRGATILHAKTLWLDCLIPFPDQPDAQRVIRYVSVLMQAIVEKEKAIRENNKQIDLKIEEELASKQKPGSPYVYAFPAISEVAELGRLDASMYAQSFGTNIFLIKNYAHGWQTYEDLGFDIGRGQNLQISCIGKSIYSDAPKSGFYRLAAPTDLSEFRTIREYRYLGSKKKLAQVRKGDVIFGAEGFCKGRAIILADEVTQTITNIHGVVFHPRDGDILRGIFLGCFLGYLRSIGLVDAIGAGGSGGSLAIGYFNHVPIPKFPEGKQAEIARLYHHDVPQPPVGPTLDTFVDWHRRRNVGLGIWELDREMKSLQHTMSEVQEQIIGGKSVIVPLSDVQQSGGRTSDRNPQAGSRANRHLEAP